MDNNYTKIRKRLFLKQLPFDTELADIVKGFDSHNFLKNPASQNIYLYLTSFVKAISEYHFSKKLVDLEILDWGCGKGHVNYLLTKLGANLKSCDIKSKSSDSSFGQKTPIIEKKGIFVIPLKGYVPLNG